MPTIHSRRPCNGGIFKVSFGASDLCLIVEIGHPPEFALGSTLMVVISSTLASTVVVNPSLNRK
eukprot:12665296-Prorocentrum_lima.AAC.1